MGISGVSPHRRPVAKATCPGCRRPVALLKSDRCVYCGTAVGGPSTPALRATKLPAELLIALEPRASAITSRSMWLRRFIALGGAGLLIALIMGPCMRA